MFYIEIWNVEWFVKVMQPNFQYWMVVNVAWIKQHFIKNSNLSYYCNKLYKGMRMGGKEISFWNVAWFKKVGRHLCPFSVECWDVIHTNILSLIFCRVKANRILSRSHLGAGIFIPVLIRFPLVTLKATNSN